MNLNFDLSGPLEDPPRPQKTRSARRVEARKASEHAEAERRRKVAEFVDEMNALTPEERRNAARIHEEFCGLVERAKQFAGVPDAERVTTISISGTRLTARTEGDVMPEVYTLFLVDQTDSQDLDPC